MAVTKPTGAPAPDKVGYAQAIRDVFITSINKGQFPFAIVGAVALLLIWRIPEQEIVPLIRWIFEALGSIYYLGFLLFVLTVFGWYFHAQRMRREFTEQLQAFKAGQKLPKPGK
ncbi:hypothetical protein [Variovorax sp. RO1]|uniref:hypothetical protein n=1 Tax=Variovorax sp. RO1 TaxID=2066034 RepID=UPI00117EA8CF|nr:hypothetical protein [Variovorax sp. RO1]